METVPMPTAQVPRRKIPPSSRWTSYEGWDFGGMKERLEDFMGTINKQAFVAHASQLFQQELTITESFSAGQHWVCFELTAEDGRLVIARARLPRHPDTTKSVTVDDETYSMGCEAATMEFIHSRLPGIPIPCLYAYVVPGSAMAAKAGCAYMLIEGFYGNTLEDVQFDICQLPTPQLERIMSQWTAIQAELGTISFPQIGSICRVLDNGEADLGKLSAAPFDGLPSSGPFTDVASYFQATAQGRLHRISEDFEHDIDECPVVGEKKWVKLGILAFLDIVQNTEIYRDVHSKGPFHFNHMDMGTQNIIVDDDFNFLAIIDWEFAQTAPWEVNHYPMPFPLTSSPAEEELILADSGHIAYDNVCRQKKARIGYRRAFVHTESRLRLAGRTLGKSIAETLDSPASKIYGCFEKLGVFPGQAETLTREMVRLAFDVAGPHQEQYFARLS